MNILLKVENVFLKYQAHFYHTRSFRDLFIRTSHAPKKILDRDLSLDVLQDINLEVRRGDRVGILGQNGAGKTSLCRCVAGIYQPTRGKITMDGSVRSVFDTMVGIYPELTGRENAEIMVKFMYPNLAHEYHEIVQEALEFSELGSFVDMPFKNYSNGMQARLCLSLISARPADLLILDEVFDGADQFFKQKISKRVTDLIQKSSAVLFVSHSPDQVSQICNRVIILQDSKIIFDGDQKAGIERYLALQPDKTIRNFDSI